MILKVVILTTLVNIVCGQICASHQKCIAEKQCGPDGKVRTDGAGLIGVRVNAIIFCGANKVCCQYKSPDDIVEYDDIFTIPKCGIRGTDTGGRFKARILADPEEDKEEQEANQGEFPWMILVLKIQPNGKYVKHCGGSLIKPNVVLSSVHNVKDIEPEDLMVRGGDWDITSQNELEKSEEKQVLAVITHEDYEKDTAANDVSLLFLEEAFTLTKHINVICLPPQGTNFDGQTCIVSGWGKTSFGPDGYEENILKKVDLPIIPFAKCDKMLKKTRLGANFNLHENFICAGGELNKDACTGDGGSPLICPIPGTNDEYYQAGIVSWGIGCGQENVPGVYANVAKFNDWIAEQVQENEIVKP